MVVGKVIIYGGRGALGSNVVNYFKLHNYWVGAIDLAEVDQADKTIIVSKDADWSTQAATVMTGLEEAIGEEKVDAIINVAGGWAGGNAAHKDFLKNCELMWSQSVWSSTITAQAAAKYLKEGGFVTLPGAEPALRGTPGMIGYGIAKAAIHQLTKSLAEENSGLPSGATAIAILPITLDTPMNRKWMAGADFSTWTSLDFIAALFLKWTKGNDRPKTGSLVKMITKDNKTELIME
ncbi:dihydropteridine reductase [Palaemon carinicauda]|uniref:dihydropteridine reductase n=1 Tax=Palaemon carinicauda TaxID=392227 RepID=UPI0035B5B5FE